MYPGTAPLSWRRRRPRNRTEYVIVKVPQPVVSEPQNNHYIIVLDEIT